MSNDDKPFSVRMGIFPEPTIQTKGLNTETLLRIVNTVSEHAKFDSGMSKHLATQFFAHRIVEGEVLLHRSGSNLRLARTGKGRFGDNFPLKALDLLAVPRHWWAVLEFIEFVLNAPDAPDEPYQMVEWVAFDWGGLDHLEGKEAREWFIASLNGVLDQMNVGYRLLPKTGKFINVHSDEEAEEIDKACSGPFDEARGHMENAVANFRNSNNANTVTEAICAVESVVKELTKKKIKSGLNQLAQEGILPEDIVVKGKSGKSSKVNPFVRALEQYWDYASKTSRHGREKGVEPPNRDTARFLLVTCASFVNYITTRWLAKRKSS